MQVPTTRFGTLQMDPADLLEFPAGLLGMESCRHWALLADAQDQCLGWMQSTTRPELALAVVTPRRFVPDYQVRVPRSELAPLQLGESRLAKVLAIVGKNDRSITLNLKAPLVLNLERRLGRQVIVTSDYPIQYEIFAEASPLRKTA